MSAWLYHAGRSTIKDWTVQRGTNKASNNVQGGITHNIEPDKAALSARCKGGCGRCHRVNAGGGVRYQDFGKLSWGGEQWQRGELQDKGCYPDKEPG